MRKKGWLVSLSHKLISMADDPEQQGSNRASLAQQFLKAASFSNHSPGNKKVKIVFSKKSLGMQLCFFFFHFSYCIHILKLPMIFKKIAYSYQSLLEFSCLISDRYISEQVKCQQKTFEMNLRDKNIPIPISSSLENTILSSH